MLYIYTNETHWFNHQFNSLTGLISPRMQIIKKLFCSHFSVNKGLIQHVVQRCYNYNITFRKLEIHTVKMRPISACYTSGRGARHFLGIGRCTILWRRSPNLARLNWRDVIGPGLINDWLRNGWCIVWTHTILHVFLLHNYVHNELFIYATLFRSRMIAFVLFIVCFRESLSDAVCDTDRYYPSSSRS